jgi:type IV pilus assembly protein PilM
VFFSKSKNVVGLDIGSSAVKLVELKEKKGGAFQLVKLGIEHLSPEAIVDGSIMDSSLVVETISRLNSSKNVKNSNYATSLSGHSVIIKKITLPAMSPEELAESIQWEAEQYIPFDINDVNLDYVPLNTPGSGDNIDVILVAVKKEKINDYTSVISQAGKVPVLVDVDAFALQNAYEMNYAIDEGKVLALVNVGASVTNVNVLSGATSLFWRDITFGGNQYTDAIQRELSLSFEQAEELKKGHQAGDYSIHPHPQLRERRLRRGAAENARFLHRHLGGRSRR